MALEPVHGVGLTVLGQTHHIALEISVGLDSVHRVRHSTPGWIPHVVLEPTWGQTQCSGSDLAHGPSPSGMLGQTQQMISEVH